MVLFVVILCVFVLFVVVKDRFVFACACVCLSCCGFVLLSLFCVCQSVYMYICFVVLDVCCLWFVACVLFMCVFFGVVF